MPIAPMGQAIIRSKDDEKIYVIQASDIEWNEAGVEERQMGPEVHYVGEMDHSILGRLTWSASEYPIGMINDTENELNGHILINNFSFENQFEDGGELEEVDITGDFSALNDDQIRQLSRRQQLSYIISWFHTQFWDPAQETPYNGREGGYLYIYGGPYHARDELEEQFSHVVEEDVINRAVEEIESDGITDWAPSPLHPDQLRAADEYYESFRPQTLDEIISALESGVKVVLDSPNARAAAEDLKLAATNLIDAIDARRPLHGGVGHNGPALDDHGNPLPEGFEHEMRESASALSAQMETTTPDPLAVAQAVSWLKLLRVWLQPRIDSAADEFAKEIGKKTASGIATAGTLFLASLVPGLDSVINAAWNWLQAIIS